MAKKIKFLEKHELGASSGTVKRIMKPGEDAIVTNNQAALLSRRKVAVIAESEKVANPVDPKEREEYVRHRLEKKDKAAVLAKLERLKVKVPKGADKAALIDLYVAEVDPGKKGKNGKKGG